MPVERRYGLDRRLETITMVAGIATVAKQDALWIIVGSASLATLNYLLVQRCDITVQHLHLQVARLQHVREDRMSSQASIAAAASCASQQRLAPHLQVATLARFLPNDSCSARLTRAWIRTGAMTQHPCSDRRWSETACASVLTFLQSLTTSPIFVGICV
jgi:hypothetical protein